MKIKYEFINGEKTEIEVEENIGTWILDSRRVEENLARKERYHNYSLETEFEKTQKIATFDTPESLTILSQDNARLYRAFEKLSDIQKQRLLMLADGMSISEIARKEHKDYKTILESIEAARKKIKKFL